MNKVTADGLKILTSIDYNNVNQAYIRGIVHNVNIKVIFSLIMRML